MKTSRLNLLSKALLLLLCLQSGTAFSQGYAARKAEERTKEKAVDLFVLLTQIDVLSRMCDEPVEVSEYSLEEGKQMLSEKLKVSFTKLREIIADETDLMKDIQKQIDDYDCLYFDNTHTISSLVSDFNVAVHALNISRELEYPIRSQKDWENSYDERLQTAINSFWTEAHIIAIGTMVKASEVPQMEKQRYYTSNADYWYVFHKGWKSEMDKYVPERTSFSFYGEDLDNFRNAMMNDTYLFFIDRDLNIVEQIEVKDENALFEQQGQPRWFYSGDSLRERRRF